ncbi:MAG: DUF6265 family protein [Aquabacterium sp.]
MPDLTHALMATAVAGLTTLAAAQPAAAPAADALAPVAWLAGCWARLDAEPGSIEQWMAPAGGTMFGMSRTLKAGRAVAHEFLELRAAPEGPITYTAHPSGQRTTSFTLARHSAQELVFENPEHDFPQRIIYRRQGDQLSARIEGLRRGKLSGIEFLFKRC